MDVWLVHSQPGAARHAAAVLSEKASGLDVTILPGDGALMEQLGRVKTGALNAPDLLLLYLDRPELAARVAEIKNDACSSVIPLLVIAAGATMEPLMETLYAHHANCCILEPESTPEQDAMYRAIAGFWAGVAKLPPVSRGKNM